MSGPAGSPDGQRRVTLTFDNGPTPGVTEPVLATLDDRGLNATFFVVGNRVARPAGRELAEQAHAAGHWIGNHTLTHTVRFGGADDEVVDGEIDETQALLGPLVHPDLLFRPYGAGGVIDRKLLGAHGRQRLLDGGYTCSLWNCLPRDWLDPDGWVDTCVDIVKSLPWSVVVVHDLPTGAMAHLGRLIDRLDAVDVEWRQDLPDACTPIRRGRPTESYALIEV
jgi:peptidoglycan/xylan/chitin deacetylase (PgdA/CDA1 family)